MIDKAYLKKIHDIFQWTVSIAMIGIAIYYFFISKDIFKEMQWLIIWGGIGIMNLGRIIDDKYFEDNFSFKNNWLNIINVAMGAGIVGAEIKTLWL